MPRYTYECTKCGHAYEKIEGWDAKPKQRCPQCRAVSQRIPAPPAIVFKGSGWYSTDNRRSLREGADGRDAGDSANGQSGDSSATDKAKSKETPAKVEASSADSGGDSGDN